MLRPPSNNNGVSVVTRFTRIRGSIKYARHSRGLRPRTYLARGTCAVLFPSQRTRARRRTRRSSRELSTFRHFFDSSEQVSKAKIASFSRELPQHLERSGKLALASARVTRASSITATCNASEYFIVQKLKDAKVLHLYINIYVYIYIY